jgi:uncharacterized protein YcsI (UPF0317 family)
MRSLHVIQNSCHVRQSNNATVTVTVTETETAAAQSSMTLSPHNVRRLCRDGKLESSTAGFANGYVQANMTILPKANAYDFLLFATRNKKPLPILDVTDVGQVHPELMCPPSCNTQDVDIRTDLPSYDVFEYGKKVDSKTHITDIWRDDFVSFLLGCSFSFEQAMIEAGIPVRHIEEQCNVPMFKTNIMCRPAGIFSGPMVVSMRPMTPAQAESAIQVTSGFAATHGAPIQCGTPESLGIDDITKPDFGDSVTIHAGEIPVFWACGVTLQTTISKVPFCITHAPGCMLVCDRKSTTLSDLL